MALTVSLSQGVLANLLALQNTTNAMNTVQNQLATGKRVNTALDDPTNFFLADAFQTNINTLSSLLDTINLGQRTIEASQQRHHQPDQPPPDCPGVAQPGAGERSDDVRA